MVAWYGDDSYDYTYSNTTKRASVWIPVLASLKEIAEARTGERFNSCLLNLYRDGREGMAWHSDDEKEMSQGASIASLSFGAERKFSFKHRQSKESRSLLLAHGSLLVMAGATQANWLHALPKMKKVSSPRIDLTFRKMNMGK